MTTITKRKIERPAYYALPLRRREDIAQWLHQQMNPYFRDGNGSFFSWNVTLPYIDFTFDVLLEQFRKAGDDTGRADDPDWLLAARQEWEWLQDKPEACYEFNDQVIEAMRQSVLDTDTWRTLWAGPDVDTKFEFLGRSGKHLCLLELEGINFGRTRLQEPVEWFWYFRGAPNDRVFLDDNYLERAEWPWLQRLYEFVVMCNHDFRSEAVKEEYAYQTMDQFTFPEGYWGNRIETRKRRTFQQRVAAGCYGGF